MKPTHQHWRQLSLHVPVSGHSDPWIAGRRLFEIEAAFTDALPPDCGVIVGGGGSMTRGDGSPVELNFSFWYGQLRTAVLAFRDCWQTLGLPDYSRLTHVERFPDCSFEFHVMIRSIAGRFDPFSTELTDDNRLGPHNGSRLSIT